MKIKLPLEDIEKYGYDAAISKFHEMTSDVQDIDYMALNQNTIDILYESEFSLKIRSSPRLPLIGIYESHNRQRIEKDRVGRIPMLCGHQIRIDNTLNDLEIEIIEK